MHFLGFLRGAKIQNFPSGDSHGATSGRHCVHYKPPVLGTLGVRTDVYSDKVISRKKRRQSYHNTEWTSPLF